MISRFVTAVLDSDRTGGPRGYVGRHRAPRERYVATVQMPLPTQRPAAASRGLSH